MTPVRLRDHSAICSSNGSPSEHFVCRRFLRPIIAPCARGSPSCHRPTLTVLVPKAFEGHIAFKLVAASWCHRGRGTHLQANSRAGQWLGRSRSVDLTARGLLNLVLDIELLTPL